MTVKTKYSSHIMDKDKPKEKSKFEEIEDFLEKPKIRIWQWKRCYDCPRNFFFCLDYKKLLPRHLKKKFRRGNRYEERRMRGIDGFSQCEIEIEYENYIVQGHLDGLTVEMIDGKLYLVGHEIKGYDCRQRNPYDRDKFQTESYLYMMRTKFPDIPSCMKLHYKNRTFIIMEFDKVKIFKVRDKVDEILRKRHTIPRINKHMIRKKYLCSSNKCDWKPICKVLDAKYRRAKK